MLDYQINKVIQESYGKVCRKNGGCRDGMKKNGKRFVRAKRLLNEEEEDNEQSFGEKATEFVGDVATDTALDVLTPGISPIAKNIYRLATRGNGVNRDSEPPKEGTDTSAWGRVKDIARGAKEGYDVGKHRTGADVARGFQRLGSKALRMAGQGDTARKWDDSMDRTVRDVYDKHSLGYEDEWTKAGTAGGRMAGSALPMAATLGGVKGAGALMGKGSPITLGPVTSRLANLADAYGWGRFGHEVGKTLEDGGHPTAGKIARYGGMAMGAAPLAKAVLGKQIVTSIPEMVKHGLPGGVGLVTAVDDVVDTLHDKDVIGDKASDAIKGAGEVAGFGMSSVPLAAFNSAVSDYPRTKRAFSDAYDEFTGNTPEKNPNWFNDTLSSIRKEYGLDKIDDEKQFGDTSAKSGTDGDIDDGSDDFDTILNSIRRDMGIE